MKDIKNKQNQNKTLWQGLAPSMKLWTKELELHWILKTASLRLEFWPQLMTKRLQSAWQRPPPGGDGPWCMLSFHPNSASNSAASHNPPNTPVGIRLETGLEFLGLNSSDVPYENTEESILASQFCQSLDSASRVGQLGTHPRHFYHLTRWFLNPMIPLKPVS